MLFLASKRERGREAKERRRRRRGDERRGDSEIIRVRIRMRIGNNEEKHIQVTAKVS